MIIYKISIPVVKLFNAVNAHKKTVTKELDSKKKPLKSEQSMLSISNMTFIDISDFYELTPSSIE
jgi:hypothetical protein